MQMQFKSKPTRQDALVVAIRYAHQFGLTNASLSREYGLNRRSLTNISQGKTIRLNRQWYYDQLILALNNARLRAKNRHRNDLAQEIAKAMLHISLVHSNIAPDDEND